MANFKSFRQWIIDTFGVEGLFSNAKEGHGFLIGVTEIVCPFPPRHKYEPSIQADGNCMEEWHYYNFGRAIGVLIWIGLAYLIKVLFF
jgi:hypothetical protein